MRRPHEVQIQPSLPRCRQRTSGVLLLEAQLSFFMRLFLDSVTHVDVNSPSTPSIKETIQHAAACRRCFLLDFLKSCHVCPEFVAFIKEQNGGIFDFIRYINK